MSKTANNRPWVYAGEPAWFPLLNMKRCACAARMNLQAPDLDDDSLQGQFLASINYLVECSCVGEPDCA